MGEVSLLPHGKAVLVKGDTRPIKDALKALGGRWNQGLVGWIFPGSKKGQILESLRGKAEISLKDETGSAGSEAGAGTAAASSAAPKRAAEEAGNPAAKKAKVVEGSSGDELVVDIGSLVRIGVSAFKGRMGVDLRKHYQDSSGEVKPTPKGVRLNAGEWEELCRAVPQIDSLRAAGSAASKGERFKLSDDCLVNPFPEMGGPGSVDIRRYYTDKKDGEQKPTKKGIMLSPDHWASLRGALQQITAAMQRAPPPAGEASPRQTPKAKEKAKSKASPRKAKAAPASANDVSDAQLQEKAAELLHNRDLADCTLRTVRSELESAFGFPTGALDAKKEVLRGIISKIVHERAA